MATTARSKRTAIPKMATKAEAPAIVTPSKAPFFARAKALVIKTTKRVVAVAKRFIAAAKPIIRRAWRGALRPYLGGVLMGAALGAVVIGAIAAPVVTVGTLLVSGIALVGLAKLVQALERNRADRMLAVLEFVGQAIRALGYAVAAAFAAAMSVASIPFMVASALMLVLGYLDVRGAGTIAFLAWCVLSGSWGFGLLWLMWRGASRVVDRAETKIVDVPEYSEIRRRPDVREDFAHRHVAVGAEEVADLVESPAWDEAYENKQACDACGTTKGATRLRSNALPFATSGVGAGKPHETSNALLCAGCYEAECEDNAIALTGVSLKRVSAHVALNALGRETLPEVLASREDPTKLFWATTAWWRDRKNNHHERQWDCFHGGKVVASVVYDHQRKVFRASALGRFIGTKTGIGAAKRLATDVLMDEGNAVTRLVEALAPEAAVQAG